MCMVNEYIFADLYQHINAFVSSYLFTAENISRSAYGKNHVNSDVFSSCPVQA